MLNFSNDQTNNNACKSTMTNSNPTSFTYDAGESLSTVTFEGAHRISARRSILTRKSFLTLIDVYNTNGMHNLNMIQMFPP